MKLTNKEIRIILAGFEAIEQMGFIDMKKMGFTLGEFIQLQAKMEGKLENRPSR